MSSVYAAPKRGKRGLHENKCWLGIDLGSTSTRVVVLDPFGEVRHIEALGQPLPRNSEFEKGEFCSNLYLDGSRPYYRGNRPDPNRQPRPAKYAFYFLVEDSSAELSEYYAFYRELQEIYSADHNGFVDRLYEGLLEHLGLIAKCVDQLIVNEKWQIVGIAASTPTHWDFRYTDIYKDLLKRVFRVDAARFVFPSEGESLAHYLLYTHVNQLIPEKHDLYDFVSLIDFGGHTMGGGNYCIRYGSEQAEGCFYAATEEFGCPGGSEVWADNIGRLCRTQVQLSDSDLRLCINHFKKIMHSYETVEDVQAISIRPKAELDWSVDLTRKDILKCFGLAFDRCFVVAKRGIKLLLDLQHSQSTTVVISGGSSLCPLVKDRISSICTDLGLQAPTFTGDLQIDYRSSSIARGTVLAASRIMTVEQFIHQGAAYAIQREGRDNLRENAGYIIYRDSMPVEGWVEVTTKPGEKLRIICNPFWEKSSESMLPADPSYDLWDLAVPSGLHKFRLHTVGKADNMAFILTRRTRAKKTEGRSEKQQPVPNVRLKLPLPLEFSVGRGCVVVMERFVQNIKAFQARRLQVNLDPYLQRLLNEPPTSITSANGPGVLAPDFPSPSPANISTRLTATETSRPTGRPTTRAGSSSQLDVVSGPQRTAVPAWRYLTSLASLADHIVALAQSNPNEQGAEEVGYNDEAHDVEDMEGTGDDEDIEDDGGDFEDSSDDEDDSSDDEDSSDEEDEDHEDDENTVPGPPSLVEMSNGRMRARFVPIKRTIVSRLG